MTGERSGIRGIVRAAAQRTPGQAYVESARDDRRVTYAELSRALEVWARWVGGDPALPVVLACRDPLAFSVAYLGLLAAGRVVAPVDAAAPSPDLQLSYAAAAPGLVVTDLHGLDERTTLPVLTVGPDGLPPAAPPEPGVPPEPAAGAVLLASSGTTGPRKGIRLAEPALLHTAAAVAASLELGPEDRGFNPLPLFHVNAEVVGLLATLTSGGTLVLDGRFARTGFWELLAARRVTWVNAVPAILAILGASTDQGEVSPTVRFVRSASAPLPAPVRERFEQQTGLFVLETYGMTEAASQIAATPAAGPRKPGSVGPAAGVELRVLDAAGTAVPAGTVGRVQIRGAAVIGGYERGAAADRFDAGGWLDTGDLGRLDADGYLFLAGRDGDVINRGGEKVFPRDVEDVLLADHGVREAVVVARDHPVLGEEPVAWIVPTGQPDEGLVERLRARCEATLSRYQRPAEVFVTGELPLGPTGKVSRVALRARG